ncbi:hypothetical protein Tco_1563844, partial [Tanacetum coccineum]
MLAQPTKDEGAVSQRPSETQPTPSPTHPSEDKFEPQPDPFLRPSSSNLIPDSIPEGSIRNHKEVTTQAAQIKDLKAQIKQLKKKAKPVISHHNAWIKSVSMKKRLARKKSLKKKLMQKESVSKQGRKPAKSEPTMHKDPAFDDLDDAMDYMETEDAHDKGTLKDSEETRVSTEDQVSTDKLKVSTDKPNKGTAEPKDGNSDESDAPTTVFRDDETISQFLTKGKKVILGKANQKVNEAEKMFKMLANDEEIAQKGSRGRMKARKEKKENRFSAEKLQEEKREKFTIEQRAKFLHDTIAAQRRFLAQQRSEAIRNKLPTRNQLRNPNDTILEERRYPLTKNTLERMMDLRLTVVSDDDTVFDLLRFIEQQIDEFRGQDGKLAILEQTTTGKGISNPLMAGSLPKTTKPTSIRHEVPRYIRGHSLEITPSDIQHSAAMPRFGGVIDWYLEQSSHVFCVICGYLHFRLHQFGARQSLLGRAFWGADDEEVSEGGIPRVIVLGYDRLSIQLVAPPSPDYIPSPEDPQTPDPIYPEYVQAHDPDYVPEPIYPEYIPLEDEHEFPTEEQPLPPDPEEYEDDETEDGPVNYPMDGEDDGDDDDDDSSGDATDGKDEDDEDEEEEEEHLAPADSAIVVPID